MVAVADDNAGVSGHRAVVKNHLPDILFYGCNGAYPCIEAYAAAQIKMISIVIEIGQHLCAGKEVGIMRRHGGFRILHDILAGISIYRSVNTMQPVTTYIPGSFNLDVGYGSFP
jgi:hypothetical protein